jgi:hypothetical protein
MNRKNTLLIALGSAFALSFIFHYRSPGINLLIAEVLLFLWIFIVEKQRFSGVNAWLLFTGTVLTAVFTILIHSFFVYFMHFISLILLAGSLIHPRFRSWGSAVNLSIGNILQAQRNFFDHLTKLNIRGLNVGRLIFKIRFYLIPALIIIAFVGMYRMSNPVYNRIFSRIGEFINDNLRWIIEEIDLSSILTFALILTLLNIFLFRRGIERIIRNDELSPYDLSRKGLKANRGHGKSSLRQHYKTAVFLLAILNILLFLLNIVDINWVWFNFNWEGEYLKQYVHNGTWLLISSILLSIAIVLVFFRGNLNYYPHNTLLRWLSGLWLAQNAVLAISVGIRTYHYISYFNLAYKRIGVIVFLILTIYGLLTVFLKVRQRKTLFHLVSLNVRAWYIVLVLFSLINWDVVIARYNFAHVKTSFLHLDYMAGLSNKALPWLDYPLAELHGIKREQQGRFPFAHSFMDPEDYHKRINDRKNKFLKEWEGKNWLEWNYPDYRAYKLLKAGGSSD